MEVQRSRMLHANRVFISNANITSQTSIGEVQGNENNDHATGHILQMTTKNKFSTIFVLKKVQTL